MKKSVLSMLLAIGSVMAPVASMAQATAQKPPVAPEAARHAGYVEHLTPDNSFLLLIDLQDMFGMTVTSIDPTSLVNNATGVVKAAKVFDVPTILASANSRTYAGPVFSNVTRARPDLDVLDRTSINAWDDRRIVEAIRKSGRKKIIIGGLWTANCVAVSALSALGDGYEVYILSDVTADITPQTQESAMQRLVQAGATPINWVALMLEWQKDWRNEKTAPSVIQIGTEHGGA